MTHRPTWACARWALAALIAGIAATTSIAWAQEPATASMAADPGLLLVELLKGGGLPAALAAAAWWARGVVGAGIPVVVSLSEHDRALLARLRLDDRTDPGPPR